ncbi:helix-turn-helix transcriptional regulator [Corynebacterium lubricantis]|uniref:helix-turn-helix transcriptional regulator n=1 Tax=Corynebacterium lubricantis TaxID=541095 RepID=UPI0006842F31|nr:helix-turn-helix transcriptional regulator [Corynebacterium lubricantis]
MSSRAHNQVIPHWASYGFNLSSRIRRLRIMRGLSQSRLAELSGVSRSLISMLERNHYNSDKSADPTLSTMYKLAAGLAVPPAVLLPGVAQMVEEVCPDNAGTSESGPQSLPNMNLQWPRTREDTARYHDEFIAEGRRGQAPRFRLFPQES